MNRIEYCLLFWFEILFEHLILIYTNNIPIQIISSLSTHTQSPLTKKILKHVSVLSVKVGRELISNFLSCICLVGILVYEGTMWVKVSNSSHIPRPFPAIICQVLNLLLLLKFKGKITDSNSPVKLLFFLWSSSSKLLRSFILPIYSWLLSNMVDSL